MSNIRVITKHYPSIINSLTADNVFDHLKYNTDWEDGIRSVNGFTRKAKSLELGDDVIVDYIIAQTLNLLNMSNVRIYGIYLNYYRNGEDYTPNHSHPGMKQIVISLGASRTLTMGKKSYTMSNGDVIVFGSAVHGVPKEPTCLSPRISIAMFVSKDSN